MALIDRMVNAVEKVRQRLIRACTTLNAAGVNYAVVGGNAIAAWVATVDEAAVRNTQDVDLLLRREDLAAAASALSNAGFILRHSGGITMFLDGPEGKARDALHIVFASEKVVESHLFPAVDLQECIEDGGIVRLGLEPLVRMKLTSFRKKDQVHLEDLAGVGLINADWVGRFPPELNQRLAQVFAEMEPPFPE